MTIPIDEVVAQSDGSSTQSEPEISSKKRKPLCARSADDEEDKKANPLVSLDVIYVK